MMSELRNMYSLLRVLGIDLEVRWIQSGVNRFEDSLLRIWDLGDILASRQLNSSIQSHYQLDPDVFAHLPMNETLPVRPKTLRVELEKGWNDGRAHLWNPQADFVPLVVRKLKQEQPQCIIIFAYWQAQALFARLRSFASSIHMLQIGSRVFQGTCVNPQWRFACRATRILGE